MDIRGTVPQLEKLGDNATDYLPMYTAYLVLHFISHENWRYSMKSIFVPRRLSSEHKSGEMVQVCSTSLRLLAHNTGAWN